MRTGILLITAVIWTGHLAPCVAADPEKPGVSQTARQKAVWIDVRTAEEFAQGHLEGAVNIPHDEIGKRIAKLVPDKNAEIHLYCRSGRRSGLARQTLIDLGYTKVINDGAYEKLKKERDTPVRK
jgi:phage shock protein E